MLGVYEMTGVLEAQYGPYETIARRHGFGAMPNQSGNKATDPSRWWKFTERRTLFKCVAGGACNVLADGVVHTSQKWSNFLEAKQEVLSRAHAHGSAHLVSSKFLASASAVTEMLPTSKGLFEKWTVEGHSVLSFYKAFGDTAQTSVADDFLTATRKAACVAMNHAWDEQGKVCLDKVGGTPIDPAAQTCTAGGWVWDDVAKKCLTPGSTPTPAPGPSTTTLVVVGAAVGIGALYLFTRKKR
jgi:hypothetical protein